MDTKQEAKIPKRKVTKYSHVFDEPLAKVQRKVATSAVLENDIKGIAKVAGVKPKNVYESHEVEAVRAPTLSKALAQAKILDGLIKELDDIISMQPETALRYSDKLKAIEIKAQFVGLTEKKQDINVNIGVLDLRQATEAELIAELDKLDNKKRSFVDTTTIDAEVID